MRNVKDIKDSILLTDSLEKEGEGRVDSLAIPVDLVDVQVKSYLKATLRVDVKDLESKLQDSTYLIVRPAIVIKGFYVHTIVMAVDYTPKEGESGTYILKAEDDVMSYIAEYIAAMYYLESL